MHRARLFLLGLVLIATALPAVGSRSAAAAPGCNAPPASASGLVGVLSAPVQGAAIGALQGDVVPPGERAPLGDLVARWSVCLASGDVRGVLGLFTADGVRRLLNERAPLLGGPGGLRISVQAVNDVVRLPDGRIGARILIDPSGTGTAPPLVVTMVIVQGGDGVWRIDSLTAPLPDAGATGPVADPAQPPTALLRRPIAPGPDTPVAAPGPVVPMRGGDAARSGSQPGPAPAAQPQEAWRAPTGWYSPAQLAAARGLVVFGGFSLGGRQAVVEALDAGQGGVRWQTTAPVGWAEIPDTPALAGDLLFVPVQAPVAGILAVVAWTGQPVWFAPFGFTSVTAPAADGDTVYTAGWGMRDPRDAAQGDAVGSVFALDQRTGREHWRFLDAARFGPLAVGRDRLYVSSNRGLLALTKNTGQKQWQARFTPLIGEAPVVIGDAVVFAGTDITSGATGVYALDAATGALRWRNDLPAAISIGAGTAAAGDAVYVAWWETPTDEDAKAPSLSAYDLATGKERWVFRATLPPDDLAQATAATMGAPVIAGGRILFGVSVQTDGGPPSVANGLYAVDAASGALVWQAGGVAIASSPAVVGEWVYVMGGAAGAQGGGNVIALHP